MSVNWSHLLTHFVFIPRRKKAVEMELAKCKIDIMSLNSQLLDAIQQKLNLSQQLEAWQVGQRSPVVCLCTPNNHFCSISEQLRLLDN